MLLGNVIAGFHGGAVLFGNVIVGFVLEISKTQRNPSKKVILVKHLLLIIFSFCCHFRSMFSFFCRDVYENSKKPRKIAYFV